MTDFDLRHLRKLAKLEKDMTSVARTSPYRGSSRAIAASRAMDAAIPRAAGLNAKCDVISALLPLVPEKHLDHLRHEYSQGPRRIECSLDFLAAIANAQAHYELKNAGDHSASEDGNELNDDDDDDSDTNEEDDCDGDSKEYIARHTSSPCDLYGDTRDESRPSPEEDAAAALLMASFCRHHQAPRPRARRRTDTDNFEGGALRSKRLSQNQLYRKRLSDKGVYPIRKGPRQYACSLCLEVFVKEMFVWRHGAKHLESKPFQCSLCGGKFNRSDSLQRHVRNFHRKK